MENQIEEIWKPIIGWEDTYQVSSWGRVRSLPRIVKSRSPNGRLMKGKIRTPNLRSHGYIQFNLYDKENKKFKAKNLHRIIAEAFIPNPENKKCINHIDANPSNNALSNLEWCTHQENVSHAVRLGLFRDQNGQKNNMVVLSDDDVIKIKTMLKNGLSCHKIHKHYFSHVSSGAIRAIKENRTWVHIQI
jgi:hypothetical protein